MWSILKTQWTGKLSAEVIKLTHPSDNRTSSHTKICQPELDLLQNRIRAEWMSSDKQGGRVQAEVKGEARPGQREAQTVLRAVRSCGQVLAWEVT